MSVILNIFNHILIKPMKCCRVQYLNIPASSVLKKHPRISTQLPIFKKINVVIPREF
jgi:hypothetical protein